MLIRCLGHLTRHCQLEDTRQNPLKSGGSMLWFDGCSPASSSSSISLTPRVGHSATLPPGFTRNPGRPPSLVDITAHSYRSATDARPRVLISCAAPVFLEVIPLADTSGGQGDHLKEDRRRTRSNSGTRIGGRPVRVSRHVTSDDLLPRFRVNPSDGSCGRVADTEKLPRFARRAGRRAAVTADRRAARFQGVRRVSSS